MSKYKFIMMSCGYVENNRTSWLMYGAQEMGHPAFETMEEAIKELALDLYAKYYDEHLSSYQNRYGLERCCTDTLIEDRDAKICRGCFTAIEDKEFIPEDFRDYICQLHNSTCDDYGDAEWTSKRNPLVWYPWSARSFRTADPSSVIWIMENAEHVLLNALYDAKPELKEKSDQDEYQDYGKDDWKRFKAGKQPSYT